MIDVKFWIEVLREKAEKAFGGNLVFFGLQGSYGCGKAKPDSDIDPVIILENTDDTKFDLLSFKLMG